MTGTEAVGVGLGFLAIVAPEFWPKMPRALSYSLAGIGLSWLTYSLILGIEELSHARLQYGPLAAIIAGAMLVGVGLLWHFSRSYRTSDTSEQSGHSVPAEAQPAQTHEQATIPSLYLECQMASQPVKVPESGKLTVARLGFAAADRPLFTWSQMVTIPNSEYRFSEGAIAHNAFRCELTNYGDHTLLDVRIDFALTYKKFLAAGGVFGSGATILERSWDFTSGKVDPGASHKIVFYILDVSPHVIELKVPSEAKAKILGQENYISVKLLSETTPKGGVISLFPQPEYKKPSSPPSKGD